MRKILNLIICFISLTATARNGYKISVKVTDKKDSVLTLAHYYATPLPKIYKTDSAKLDKNGIAHFESKDTIVGGMYLMMFSDHATYFDFILNDGDDIGITITTAKLPNKGLVFKNSPENIQFYNYMGYLDTFGKEMQNLQTKFSLAKTAKDSDDIRNQSMNHSKKLTEYRRAAAKVNPNSFMSSVFKALDIPVVPEGKHYLPDGKLDSNFSYFYYKNHFWDNFNFNDNRLIMSPILDARLDEYINKLVIPSVDSSKKECDFLLAKARPSKDLFKYTLWWLTGNYERSKIMGMDAVFVYLVENYYMKGDAFWLTNEDLQKYFERVSKIAPNVIGNIAPEINMYDSVGKPVSLSSVNANYTLLVFFSPNCGHCQHEVPIIDSLYKKVLKAKGVKVFTVQTEDSVKAGNAFFSKHNISKDWVNVSCPDHTCRFRDNYDISMTPVIYLLDEKKIIRGKRLDHTNIASLIEHLEDIKNKKIKK